MSRMSLTLTLTVVTLAAPGRARVVAVGDGGVPDRKAVADDTARLQGIWEMAENVVNGTRATDRQTRGWLLVVEGNVYNPGLGETSIEYQFRIDPTLTPKAIDFVPVRGPESGRTYRGIYAIDGDTFTVCRPLDPDDDRPAGFTVRPGSVLTRVVWRRRKGP